MIGKSIYIWDTASCLGGDVKKIASTLKAAGFQSAILHGASLDTWRIPLRINLIWELKAAGILPYGGAGVYGKNPEQEGRLAAAICGDYGLAGFVFDAESAFDVVPQPDSAAVKLLKTYRSSTDAKAGWCWWPFYQSPNGKYTYHPKSILWAAMDPRYGNADFGVTMAYWSWGDSPQKAVEYLEESWRQWRKMTDKPVCPAGRAYIGNSGTPTPEAIAAYEKRARELGAPGVTWWSLQHALDAVHLPKVWGALSALPRFGEEPPVVPPVVPLTLEQRVEILEKRAREAGWEV